MPNYVIEREIPGASKMSEEQVKDAALKSLGVLKELGPQIQWLHSYVTDDKVYCIYWAPNEEIIKQHAQQARNPRQPDFRGSAHDGTRQRGLTLSRFQPRIARPLQPALSIRASN